MREGILLCELFDVISVVWLYFDVIVWLFVDFVVKWFDCYDEGMLLFVIDVLVFVDVIWWLCLFVVVFVEGEMNCVFENVVSVYLGGCVVMIFDKKFSDEVVWQFGMSDMQGDGDIV